MESKNIEYISKIDHVRFWASITVIFAHLTHWCFLHNGGFYSIVKELAGGVTLFLILSGFLFTLIVNKSEMKSVYYRKFIYNRFLRIFPLTIFCFFIVMAVMREQFHGYDIFQLFFLNTGSSSEWGHEAIIIPWWTISVEFTFYLIFPFLIDFSNKYGVKYLFGLCVLMNSLRFVLTKYRFDLDLTSNFYYTLIGRLDQLIIGMIACWFFLKYQGPIKKIFSNKLTFLFVGCIIISWFYYKKQILSYNLCGTEFCIEGVMMAALMLCILLTNINLPNFMNKTIEYLGKISFSTYLFHAMVGAAFARILFPTETISKMAMALGINYNYAGFIAICCILPFIFAFSSLTFFLIEKPFLTYRVKYLKTKEEEERIKNLYINLNQDLVERTANFKAR